MEQISFPEEQEASGPLVCQWRDCNKAFTGHPSLAVHLSDDHVGWKKGDYFCEWTNCARRGAKCHNRFALMMHLRIHTGEKPFECTYSDCGQAFGRMDALTRHKRTEHGEDSIPQPALTMKKTTNKKTPSEPKPKKARISGKYPIASLCPDDNSNEEEERENLVTVENTSNKLLLNVTSDYSQYRIAKAQLNYLLRENEMLQEEYDIAQKKIKRLKTEREVLLESAMLHDHDE